MPKLNVELKGLNELISELQKPFASKNIGIALSKTTLDFHNQINRAVLQRYNTNISPENALLTKRPRILFENNRTVSEIDYLSSPKDLSKYPYTFHRGNINPNAKRQGDVHVTEVVKGRKKIVYGKTGRGGFVPREPSGRAKRFGRFGSQMFERTSKKRYPIRLVVGPSIGNLITNVIKAEPSIKAYQNKLPEILLNYL